MAGNCAHCGIRTQCDNSAVLVYAPTSILRDKTAAILSSASSPCSQTDGIFRIQQNPKEALALLDARLNAVEKGDLRVSQSSIRGVFTSKTLAEFIAEDKYEWFEEALLKDAFSFFYQPIVDVSAGQTFAHECLIRLIGTPSYNGGQIIEAATKRTQIHEFDAYCRQKAIRSAGQFPKRGSKVFINFLPSSIYDPARCLQSTIKALQSTDLTPEDVIFEVVESDEVRSVPHLKTIAEFYRREGFGFALDDVGSGANSLQMICDFRPDYIKLDKSMTDKLDDAMRLTAVRKVTELAQEFGVRVIAEGVETAASKAHLESVGISLMQGWFFGKPGPVLHMHDEDLRRLFDNVASNEPASLMKDASISTC